MTPTLGHLNLIYSIAYIAVKCVNEFQQITIKHLFTTLNMTQRHAYIPQLF